MPNDIPKEVKLSGVQNTDVEFAKCDGRNNGVLPDIDEPKTNGVLDQPDCNPETYPDVGGRNILMAMKVCLLDLNGNEVANSCD